MLHYIANAECPFPIPKQSQGVGDSVTDFVNSIIGSVSKTAEGLPDLGQSMRLLPERLDSLTTGFYVLAGAVGLLAWALFLEAKK